MDEMEISPLERLLEELKQEDIKSFGKRKIVAQGMIYAVASLRTPLIFEEWMNKVGVKHAIDVTTKRWDGQDYISGILSVIHDISDDIYNGRMK